MESGLTSRFSGGFDKCRPSIHSLWLAPLIFDVGRKEIYDAMTAIKQLTIASIGYSTAVSWPIMFGLSVSGPDMVFAIPAVAIIGLIGVMLYVGTSNRCPEFIMALCIWSMLCLGPVLPFVLGAVLMDLLDVIRKDTQWHEMAQLDNVSASIIMIMYIGISITIINGISYVLMVSGWNKRIKI